MLCLLLFLFDYLINTIKMPKIGLIADIRAISRAGCYFVRISLAVGGKPTQNVQAVTNADSLGVEFTVMFPTALLISREL
jgi:hypothetical protein